MTWVDFNSDLGESFGQWTLGDDAAMVRSITSANLDAAFTRATRAFWIGRWRCASQLPSAAADAGLRFVREAFADRRYEPDGTLQSRAVAGSLLTAPAEAAEQALLIVHGRRVVAHDGSRVAVEADSICFHGDTPGAPEIAAEARRRLEAAGVAIRSFA